MNTDRLNGIVNKYIAKADVINGFDNFEDSKWLALTNFQERFDIDAPDFAAMFKNAVSGSLRVIEDRTAQPTLGILEIAEHEPETARELFKELFADDKGDIKARQVRINKFTDSANELLEKYAPGKWKLKQEFRSTLCFLALMKPAENYFYRAARSHAFLRYLEFDEIGTGEDFDLEKYYEYCDTVRGELKKNEELMQLDSSRWNSRIKDEGDDLRLTVFDLMTAGKEFRLYPFADYMRRPAKDKAEWEKEYELVTASRFTYMACNADLVRLWEEYNAASETEVKDRIMTEIKELEIMHRKIKAKLEGYGVEPAEL